MLRNCDSANVATRPLAVFHANTYQYLDCGDLTKGFARVYCENCKKSMLLSFSCKGR
jgi:hypothetical protein